MNRFIFDNSLKYGSAVLFIEDWAREVGMEGVESNRRCTKIWPHWMRITNWLY